MLQLKNDQADKDFILNRHSGIFMAFHCFNFVSLVNRNWFESVKLLSQRQVSHV